MKQENRDYAPICLFCYNRLDELKECVESLRKNYLASESDLFIFSDGPKNINGIERINEVRNYVHTITGFRSVTIVEAKRNKGLANSIIDGVTRIIKLRGKVIVVEDDLISSPNFLNFMNQSLDFYIDNSSIFSISGYTLNLKMLLNFGSDYYMALRASSWGWATWLDRWNKIDWSISDYSSFKYNIFKQVRFAQGGNDLPIMLHYQKLGIIDSWAIRFCYHQFQHKMYTVFPRVSKIISIGINKNATHTKSTNKFITPLDAGIQRIFSFNDKIELDKRIIKEFRCKFSYLNRTIQFFNKII